MSDHTPPRYWDDWGRARQWLANFLSDVADYQSWTIDDLGDLCDEIFVEFRRGWKTRIVLKKPFRRNPDVLLAFVKDFQAKKGQN